MVDKLINTINFIPEGSRLSFIKEVDPLIYKYGKYENKYRMALYRCSCGLEKIIMVGNVKSGKSLSCGCLTKEIAKKTNTVHGLRNHPLYRVWSDVKTRCYNPNKDCYKYYGGIGIKMCDEWINNFKSFYDWAILNGWRKGLKLDKDTIPKRLGIDALVYSPDMCMFVTHKENCNARKSNRPLTYNGQTKNMTQWEKELHFPKDLIYQRLKSGWSVEKALTTPLVVRNR